jgi:hypothetical protein
MKASPPSETDDETTFSRSLAIGSDICKALACQPSVFTRQPTALLTLHSPSNDAVMLPTLHNQPSDGYQPHPLELAADGK